MPTARSFPQALGPRKGPKLECVDYRVHTSGTGSNRSSSADAIISAAGSCALGLHRKVFPTGNVNDAVGLHSLEGSIEIGCAHSTVEEVSVHRTTGILLEFNEECGDEAHLCIVCARL